MAQELAQGLGLKGSVDRAALAVDHVECDVLAVGDVVVADRLIDLVRRGVGKVGEKEAELAAAVEHAL